MGMHFATEAEAHLNRFATISPDVISAIENNREAFMALMAKIQAEFKGAVLAPSIIDPDNPADPVLVKEAEGLVLATYLLSFLVQDISYGHQALGIAHNEGCEDGHAYAAICRMRAN